MSLFLLSVCVCDERGHSVQVLYITSTTKGIFDVFLDSRKHTYTYTHARVLIFFLREFIFFLCSSGHPGDYLFLSTCAILYNFLVFSYYYDTTIRVGILPGTILPRYTLFFFMKINYDL